MTRRQTRTARLLAALVPCLVVACGGLNLSDIAAFLGPSVTVVIENGTSFTAIPDLRAGDSRNIAEDLFADDDRITAFGTGGAVLPNQTVTVRLRCDDDLERIAFKGAEFHEGNGFPLGDVDADITLRRDDDFDCGDVIHIRLSGSVFNFYADVDLERSAAVRAQANGDADGGGEEIAGFLDDLFD